MKLSSGTTTSNNSVIFFSFIFLLKSVLVKSFDSESLSCIKHRKYVIIPREKRSHETVNSIRKLLTFRSEGDEYIATMSDFIFPFFNSSSLYPRFFWCPMQWSIGTAKVPLSSDGGLKNGRLSADCSGEQGNAKWLPFSLKWRQSQPLEKHCLIAQFRYTFFLASFLSEKLSSLFLPDPIPSHPPSPQPLHYNVALQQLSVRYELDCVVMQCSKGCREHSNCRTHKKCARRG